MALALAPALAPEFFVTFSRQIEQQLVIATSADPSTAARATEDGEGVVFGGDGGSDREQDCSFNVSVEKSRSKPDQA